MSVDSLSPSAQNYLKAIWNLAEWSTEPVTPTLIAQRTGLKLSSVSDAVRRLTDQGLVSHDPYGTVTLTDEGRVHALAMVRRHRLIETFLVATLGYRWDQVHDEAEVLEHAVSDFMIERIDELLEYPARDPHGDPIPTADGTITLPPARPLSEITGPARVLVERISDTDPELLKYFDSHGIGINIMLDVEPGPPFSDALHVRADSMAAPLTLGQRATEALYVSYVGGAGEEVAR